MTLRQQLYNATIKCESAFANLQKLMDQCDEARREYDDARQRQQEIIDAVMPIHEPNGREVEVPRQYNKIGLIKLVRRATSKHGAIESAKIGHPQGTNVFGIMGLKDAKDLVEEYIADGAL